MRSQNSAADVILLVALMNGIPTDETNKQTKSAHYDTFEVPKLKFDFCYSINIIHKTIIYRRCWLSLVRAKIMCAFWVQCTHTRTHTGENVYHVDVWYLNMCVCIAAVTSGTEYLWYLLHILFFFFFFFACSLFRDIISVSFDTFWHWQSFTGCNSMITVIW